MSNQTSLVIKDLVYEAKAKAGIFSQGQGQAKAKNMKIFQGQGQGHGLHEVSSKILEAKARPRGQQDCTKYIRGHQTHYRAYQGRVFMTQMTRPTVSKHWRKIGPKD